MYSASSPPSSSALRGRTLNTARSTLAILVAVLGMAAAALFVTASATPVAAQVDGDSCLGGSGDYPPPAPTPGDETVSLIDVSLPPGGVGTVEIGGADPGGVYCGFVYSDPISLPSTAAAADGSLTFSNLSVPDDFPVSRTHSIDLFRDGAIVLSTPFCLDSTGSLASVGACDVDVVAQPRADGDDKKLAFTGVDGIILMLQAAALLVATGVVFRHLRRRRIASLG